MDNTYHNGFLAPDDFLILEKNTGNVKRFVNGSFLEKPLLHIKPSIKDEQGLLGIAISETNYNNYNDVLRYIIKICLTTSLNILLNVKTWSKIRM